jgi:hypothetical protein
LSAAVGAPANLIPGSANRRIGGGANRHSGEWRTRRPGKTIPIQTIGIQKSQIGINSGEESVERRSWVMYPWGVTRPSLSEPEGNVAHLRRSNGFHTAAPPATASGAKLCCAYGAG